METGSIGSTGNNTNDTSINRDTKPAGGELGKDQFMTLLVSQLKNQDPLKPVANTEFITQLATFSSLEKLTSIEALLKIGLPVPQTTETSL